MNPEKTLALGTKGGVRETFSWEEKKD